MPPQQKSQQPRQQPPQHSQDGLPVQQTQVTPRNCITVFNAYKSRKRAKKNAPAKQGLLSQVVSEDSNDSDCSEIKSDDQQLPDPAPVVQGDTSHCWRNQ